MPLIARLAGVGMLDATLPDLGAGVEWSRLHRVVDPRPMLSCVGCGGRVHAKVSPAPSRLRYFAHDSVARDCVVAGESAAHRALKTELARAVRRTGWLAELEVPGDGWRADVLATSPDGIRRFAWEAQLSSISVDEIIARTTTMQASGLEVCWVARRHVAWLGHVPSIQLELAAPNPAEPADHMMISAGISRFVLRKCEPPARCTAGRIGWEHHAKAETCSCRGMWENARDVPLEKFVAFTCAGTVIQHQPVIGIPSKRKRARTRRGPWTWTAEHYVKLEEQQLVEPPAVSPSTNVLVSQRRHAWAEYVRAAEATRQDRTAALYGPVSRYFERSRSASIRLHPAGAKRYAEGVPVYIGRDVVAVIEPLASLVNLLPHDMEIIVGCQDEASKVAAFMRGPERPIVVLVPDT